MKKFIIALFSLLLFLVFFLPRNVVVASETKESVSSYELPYPGILPDSPLYVFKVVRDYLTEFFIFDNQEKAFLQIFLADKRLASSEQLINNKKYPLAAVTILNAQNYLLEAFKNGRGNLLKNDLWAKLTASLFRHRSAISDLEKKYVSRETQEARRINNDLSNEMKKMLLPKAVKSY